MFALVIENTHYYHALCYYYTTKTLFIVCADAYNKIITVKHFNAYISSMSTDVKPQLEAGWLAQLRDEFEQPYFKQIKQTLLADHQNGYTIYPPGKLIFNAFNLTPFEEVKVVILGQDPYHGPGQAHGLCFSVQHGVKPPPSLENMFKELATDVGMQRPNHGNLESWAKQGVFLLNAFLTVRASSPASHSKIGWEQFTDAVIKKLSDGRSGLVFLLWGKFAQQKAELIDRSKHHILMAPHPSPFSANRGFFGCKHFSKANQLLQQQGLQPVDWSLDS